MSKSADSRRDFVKKAAYVTPAILTLMAAPSFAKPGSEKNDDGGPGDKEKPPKPKKPPKDN